MSQSNLFPLQSQPFPSSSQKINAWTDGSCSVKHCRSGGWAFHVRYQGRVLEGVGSETATTISAMELTAIIKLLERLKPHSAPLQIHSDSQYAVNSLTDWVFNWMGSGWIGATGKPVACRHLIERAHALLMQHRERRPVALVWIRGHVGDAGNERCDQLAGNARRALVRLVASPDEPPPVSQDSAHVPTAPQASGSVVARAKGSRVHTPRRLRGAVSARPTRKESTASVCVPAMPRPS